MLAGNPRLGRSNIEVVTFPRLVISGLLVCLPSSYKCWLYTLFVLLSDRETQNGQFLARQPSPHTGVGGDTVLAEHTGG